MMNDLRVFILNINLKSITSLESIMVNRNVFIIFTYTITTYLYI